MEASNHWMAYGSAITQIIWCFLLCFVYPIIALTCCKGKQACEQFTVKRWIPLYVIGGLAGASGINGVIALWMPVENTDDSLLGNFRFFLIMTMILNIFGLIPAFFVVKFIVEKSCMKKNIPTPEWLGGYCGNFCWVIFGFIAVGMGWKFAFPPEDSSY